MLKNFGQRLKEPSTWAGFGLFANGAAEALTQTNGNWKLAGLSLLSGLLAMMMREKGATPPQ